jgi:hypothetical protein
VANPSKVLDEFSVTCGACETRKLYRLADLKRLRAGRRAIASAANHSGTFRLSSFLANATESRRSRRSG